MNYYFSRVKSNKVRCPNLLPTLAVQYFAFEENMDLCFYCINFKSKYEQQCSTKCINCTCTQIAVQHQQYMIYIDIKLHVEGDVLGGGDPGVPEHLRAGHRAPPPARLARQLPGGHQLLLRHPLHPRDVLQDVRARHRVLLHPPLQPVRLLCGDQFDPGDGVDDVECDAAAGHVRAALHSPPPRLQGM